MPASSRKPGKPEPLEDDTKKMRSTAAIDISFDDEKKKAEFYGRVLPQCGLTVVSRNPDTRWAREHSHNVAAIQQSGIELECRLAMSAMYGYRGTVVYVSNDDTRKSGTLIHTNPFTEVVSVDNKVDMTDEGSHIIFSQLFKPVRGNNRITEMDYVKWTPNRPCTEFTSGGKSCLSWKPESEDGGTASTQDIWVGPVPIEAQSSGVATTVSQGSASKSQGGARS